MSVRTTPNSQIDTPEQVFVGGASEFRDEFDEEYFNSLLDTYLRPFEDDEILANRLAQPSRVFRKQPEAVELVEEALQSDDDDSIIIAAELLDDSLKNSLTVNDNPANLYLSHLTTIKDMAKIKNHLLGEDSPNDRINALTYFIEQQIISRVPDDKLLEYVYTGLHLNKRIKELKNSPEYRLSYPNFVEASLIVILNGVRQRYDSEIYAEKMPGHDEELPTAEQIEADSAEVAETFSELHRNRHYGIKLAYKPYRYGGSLIYSEPVGEEMAEQAATQPNVHPLTVSTPSVATVIHSGKRSFKNLKPDPVDFGAGVKGLSFTGLDSIIPYHIGPDGELYSDRQCTRPLRDVFARKGKYGAYRDLQAEVLASYFDLTQPAEVANSAGKIAKRHVEDMTDAEKQEPMSTFRRLVVPRLRYLSDEPEAVEDAAEAEESQDSTSGGQKTLRRHHRVALHRRTLPEGWSASPEALKRALDQGIDLAPNETVVKAHGRGSKKVGEVVAHQLVRRQ